jgi:hypothetical protein
MATISVYDVNDISIVDLATGEAPSGNPLTAQEDGLALNNQMAWPFRGFEITLGGTTTEIEFADSDGLLSDDPTSGSSLIDQQLTSDLSIAGDTFTANSEITLWQNPAPVFVQNEYEALVTGPDGTEYTMVAVSIGEGYSFTIVGVTFEGDAPAPGTTLTYSYNSAITNHTSSVISAVPCFVRGTRIKTNLGVVRIEDLCVGMSICTQNSQAEPIRWIGSKIINRQELAKNPKLRPVCITAGALGGGFPERDLLVSRQHRMLVSSRISDRMFGTKDVLIPAIKLTKLTGIYVENSVDTVEYFHILLNRHEVIFAEGAPSESLFTGPEALKAVSSEAREEIFAIFPELSDKDYTPKHAALVPTNKEQKTLVTRHAKNNKTVLECQ